MTNDYNDVDSAMERLQSRSWREPDLDRLVKEKSMNRSGGRIQTFVRSHTALALVLALLIGASAAAGVAAAVSSFRGVIVDEDGNEYNVDLRPLGGGLYEGETDDGTRIMFQTDDGNGGDVTVELEGDDTMERTVEIEESGGED